MQNFLRTTKRAPVIDDPPKLDMAQTTSIKTQREADLALSELHRLPEIISFVIDILINQKAKLIPPMEWAALVATAIARGRPLTFHQIRDFVHYDIKGGSAPNIAAGEDLPDLSSLRDGLKRLTKLGYLQQGVVSDRTHNTGPDRSNYAITPAGVEALSRAAQLGPILNIKGADREAPQDLVQFDPLVEPANAASIYDAADVQELQTR